MKLIRVPDYLELSRTAARFVLEHVRDRGASRLALPAGNTPVGLYAELVRLQRAGELDFSQLTIFHLDEYIGVGSRDPRSFAFFLEQHLLKRVPVPREHVHFLNGLATDLDQECARFESVIQTAGGIDLLIAGIGGNGHVAFNEPGSPFNSRTRAVTLATETPGPLRQALTMGIGTIMEARAILLPASGANKAEAIHRLLQEKPDTAVPASGLRWHPNLTVIVDEAAGIPDGWAGSSEIGEPPGP